MLNRVAAVSEQSDRVNEKKPSDWIFDGYACRMMGARQCGRSADAPWTPLLQVYIPHLFHSCTNQRPIISFPTLRKDERLHVAS